MQDQNPFEPPETTEEQDRRVGRKIRENADKRMYEAMRVEGVPVIFCKDMQPGLVLPEPLFSKPDHPVFMCRSREDLLGAIDRHFWRELGIEDPRR